jgi:hypothetical protein
VSNHSGSDMLNEFLHGLVKIGVLKEISSAQRRSIRQLLSHAVHQYDCNWGEVIDVDLAQLLKMCACCRCTSRKVSAKYGYCARCEHEAQQDQV